MANKKSFFHTWRHDLRHPAVRWTVFIIVACLATFFLLYQIRVGFTPYINSLLTGNQITSLVFHKTTAVSMTAKGFSVSKLVLRQGDKIIFTNADTKPHWPAAGPHDHHDEAYSTNAPLSPGQSATFTFPKPGQWIYHDHLYQDQTFTLTVTENTSGIAKVIEKIDTGINQIKDTLVKANCTPADGHAEGALTSNYDSAGKLTGWHCSMGSHMNCYAGSDGIWKTCDFPPDLMVWPPAVPKNALDNPSAYIPPKINY